MIPLGQLTRCPLSIQMIRYLMTQYPLSCLVTRCPLSSQTIQCLMTQCPLLCLVTQCLLSSQTIQCLTQCPRSCQLTRTHCRAW
ncbi:unnamed protein product [Staurois parvus]|uniref:Uncharacterized protein n=1 Tax=Staurois parvus TaxID=386267 RepID=A0ABN9AT11_9NEOB|nr:unnamed protein product [Staurois parvus]